MNKRNTARSSFLYASFAFALMIFVAVAQDTQAAGNDEKGNSNSKSEKESKSANPLKQIGKGIRGFGGRLQGVGARSLKEPYIKTLADTRDFSALAGQSKMIAENAGLNLRADARRDIVHSASTQKYLEGIRDKLLVVWPYEGPTPPIYIIASPFYEMSATHDGGILVNTGMLKAADSEDEIAYLLGHELGHILLGHFIRDEMTQDLVRRARLTADIVMLSNSVASSGIHQVNSPQVLQVVQDKGAINQFNAKSYSILDDTEDSIAYGFLPQWKRGHEDQADILAIDLLVGANYSLDAAPIVFEKISQANVDKKAEMKRLKARMDELATSPMNVLASVSSSPNSAAQIQSLAYGNTAALAPIFASAWSGIRKAGRKDLVESTLVPEHRKPEARKKSVVAYFDKFYVDHADAGIILTEDPLNNLRMSKDYNAAVSAADQVFSAKKAMSTGDYTAADEYAMSALSGYRNDFPQARWVRHRVRQIQGNPTKAIENLELALNSSHPGHRTYDQLASLYYATGQRQTAMSTATKGEKRFSNNVHFLPERIFSVALTDKTKAGDLMLTCLEAEQQYLDGPCQAAYFGMNPNYRREFVSELSRRGCAGREKRGSGGARVFGNVANALSLPGLGQQPARLACPLDNVRKSH